MENLRESECNFLEERFQETQIANNYFYGNLEGPAESLDSVLEAFFSLNSTSFVRTETHVKSKNHKRYSCTGNYTVNKLFLFPTVYLNRYSFKSDNTKT